MIFGGFPALPPLLPVYPGFSIILSPYTQGRGKNRTQRIVIHYNFIGVLDLPEVEEYPENVVLDSRQGVAIEYLVGKAG